jgi:hypothetical protein
MTNLTPSLVLLLSSSSITTYLRRFGNFNFGIELVPEREEPSVVVFGEIMPRGRSTGCWTPDTSRIRQGSKQPNPSKVCELERKLTTMSKSCCRKASGIRISRSRLRMTQLSVKKVHRGVKTPWEHVLNLNNRSSSKSSVAASSRHYS